MTQPARPSKLKMAMLALVALIAVLGVIYVVCGFLATPRGLGILGRASKKRVVNVGQKGGMTGILVLV